MSSRGRSGAAREHPAFTQKFQGPPLFLFIDFGEAVANRHGHRFHPRSHVQLGTDLLQVLRNANSGHSGSITTVHADSAALAFEQLTLLVRNSEGGRGLPRDDIRALLHLLVDIVVQTRKVDGRFRVTEIWHEPDRKRRPRD